MKTPVRWFVAALVPIAGALSALPVVTPSASASPTTQTSWSTLDQTGLAAASTYRAEGALTVVGSPSPVSDSTVTTASGVVSVAQRTVVAEDTSGTVLVNLTLLGGRQLVVTERSPGAGLAGATLVLEPGSSTVAGTYPQPAIAGTATSATGHGSTVPISTATWRRVSQAAHRSRPGVDRLVTIGGCDPYPAPPSVIGSTFGPLVEGEGVTSCLTTETLALVVADYRGGTHVGNTATGSGRGTWLGITAYDGCSVISGTNGFHTAQLWSVNGIVQGGATSGTASLHCA
jgi:hypothetical protein